MIRVEFCPPYSMRVEGHAGYAPRGQDIICAGASALYGALVSALYAAEKSGKGALKIEEDEHYIVFKPASNEEEIATIFDTVWQGYLLLAGKYGDYLVAIKEEDQD